MENTSKVRISKVGVVILMIYLSSILMSVDGRRLNSQRLLHELIMFDRIKQRRLSRTALEDKVSPGGGDRLSPGGPNRIHNNQVHR